MEDQPGALQREKRVEDRALGAGPCKHGEKGKACKCLQRRIQRYRRNFSQQEKRDLRKGMMASVSNAAGSST